MATQEATSSLRVGRSTEYRMGSDTELLAVGGDSNLQAKLFVLDGERRLGYAAQAFRSGDFTAHMARGKVRPPVSMVTCAVGDHQWMLAKDALVARVDARRFVFGLPGLCYGLELLPESGAVQKGEVLEEIFARFAAYQDLSALEGGDPNSDADPWARAHSKMEKLTTWHATTTHGTSLDDPIASGKRNTERAVRTSAVVKLLSRSLLTGALHPVRHLHVALGDGSVDRALPSMWAVADLLDAVETGRASMGREVTRARDGLGWWCVNVEGVLMLLRVIRAVRPALAVEKKRRRDEDDVRSGRGLHSGMRSCSGARSAAVGSN